jgi:ABC-type glycerol-3-phosphate transport system permease component
VADHRVLPVPLDALGQLQGQADFFSRADWTNAIYGIFTQAETGSAFTTRGYYGAWVTEEFWRAVLNTAIVVFFTVIISLTFGTLGGYALARSGFRYAFWLLMLALVFRAMPHITLVSGYLLPFFEWNIWGILPTTIIVLVAINQPFTLWMLHSFFKNIPKDLDESAMVDGCTRFQAFWHVIIPVMWPGVITTGLFSFLLAYNDFAVTAMLLSSENQTMIPATGRLVYLPFASFFRVDDGTIVETVEFLDILSVIHQAGCNPFAGAQTASEIMAPGPRTLDGVMHEPGDAEDGRSTLALSNAMLDDLVEEMRSPDEHLQRFWHGDMNWFGPTGIGSCLGHDGYRRGHTQPFETGLDLVEAIYPGPCNIAEGCFSAHFWRPGLRMRPAGGFLGLPPKGEPADIRVADIYRRDGDKLAENWVFIDMLHFLRMQGVDLFADISANASAF